MDVLYNQFLLRGDIDQNMSGCHEKKGKMGKKRCAFLDPKHCTIQSCFFVRRDREQKWANT